MSAESHGPCFLALCGKWSSQKSAGRRGVDKAWRKTIRVTGFGLSYRRHEPEKSELYEVVAEHWNTFMADAERDSEGRGIPSYVKEEFEAYLKCGILLTDFFGFAVNHAPKNDWWAFHVRSEAYVHRAEVGV